MPSGTLIDYDPAAGRILWHFRTNANVSNEPMAYELDGKQFRVAAAGKTLFAFTLKQADTGSLRLTAHSPKTQKPAGPALPSFELAPAHRFAPLQLPLYPATVMPRTATVCAFTYRGCK